MIDGSVPIGGITALAGLRVTALARLDGPPLPESEIGQIEHAWRHEMAQRLADAMFVSTYLGYERAWDADQLAPSSIPMGRIAEVEEVANLVVMLASPLMHMVNGTMIEIDGGQEKSLMDRLRDKK